MDTNMRQHIIRATDEGKFYIYWRENGSEVPNSAINLDFNPLMEKIKSSSDIDSDSYFEIWHFQARPKGYRQWGIYIPTKNEYRSFREMKSYDNSKIVSVMLDETVVNAVPTAVLLVYPS